MKTARSHFPTSFAAGAVPGYQPCRALGTCLRLSQQGGTCQACNSENHRKAGKAPYFFLLLQKSHLLPSLRSEKSCSSRFGSEEELSCILITQLSTVCHGGWNHIYFLSRVLSVAWKLVRPKSRPGFPHRRGSSEPDCSIRASLSLHLPSCIVLLRQEGPGGCKWVFLRQGRASLMRIWEATSCLPLLPEKVGFPWTYSSSSL